jgi:hypothetical protein
LGKKFEDRGFDSFSGKEKVFGLFKNFARFLKVEAKFIAFDV